MAFKFKCNTKPEKGVVAATIACILSIIFSESRKKQRGSKKYRSFPKRFVKYYKLADDLLSRTVAKDIKNTQFKDKKLEALTIENGEFIDI